MLALLIDLPTELTPPLPQTPRLWRVVTASAETSETNVDLIVIGPNADNPVQTAQRSMQRNPAAELIIISRNTLREEVLQQLKITPYVPPGVKVLNDDLDTITRSVNETINRIERKHQLAQVLRHSAEKLTQPTPFATNAIVQHENQRRLFSAVVESSYDAILTQSPDGIITSWNRGAESLYGYTAAQAIGQSIRRLMTAQRAIEHDRLLEQLQHRESISHYETEHRHQNGHELAVALSLSPVEDYQGKWVGVSIIARDISEQRRILSSLAALQARQAAILNAALDAIITIDHHSIIIEFNPAAASIFGYSHAEAMGKSLAEMIIPPRLREAHNAGLQKLLLTGEGPVLGKRIELPGIRRNGEEFPLEVSILQLNGSNPPLFTGFIRDLTEAKQIEHERQRLVEDLKRSNEELEQFAYVASHDLKEPLRMVASYTELLAQRYQNKIDEKADKYIHYIVDGATRMRRMIDDLLAYSRMGSREKNFAPVDCNQAVQRAQQSLQMVLRDSQSTIICDPLPIVCGDSTMLTELFQNLIHNAIKFRAEPPPRIVIQARRDAAEWVFSVADNGIGFEMEHAKRIFQMFQRLHERGKYEGSGMGLAIVKKILDRHGGRIWAHAKPNEGATFYFTLPAISE